jgi:hypothetical protein
MSLCNLPGASKLRGPPEAAAPRANRGGGAFPRARRAVQTWAAWGPSGGTVETGKSQKTFLTLHSFNVTLFTLGFRLFLSSCKKKKGQMMD